MRILADQCRRREKLRKRGLATWQQHMHALLQQAITLDHQLLGTPDASPAAKQSAATKLAAAQTSHRQSGSSRGSHSKAADSKQALQLAAEIADATENAQAKFEHDMALSLQLTKAVAEEAAKLHHVKIVRAESSQAEEAALGAGPPEAKGAGHPCPAPTDPPPAAQLEGSPSRMTRFKQAQATPPAATSDPAAGRKPASAPVMPSAPQRGSPTAASLLKGCHGSAGITPHLGQGSPVKAPVPALSQRAADISLSPRRSSRQQAGDMSQAAVAAAAAEAAVEVESSAQRVTRSMHASVSGRTDDASPSASNRHAGRQPTPPSHTHRHTRSMLTQSQLHNSAELHGEEEEQAGHAHLAGSLEVEAHESQVPSSSSCERRGRSARSPAQQSVATASPQTGMASGDERRDRLKVSPRQTKTLREQLLHESSHEGGQLLLFLQRLCCGMCLLWPAVFENAMQCCYAVLLVCIWRVPTSSFGLFNTDDLSLQKHSIACILLTDFASCTHDYIYISHATKSH